MHGPGLLYVVIALVLLFSGLWVAPASALAAPTLAVSPTSGPPGATFTIRRAGFQPRAAVYARELDPDSR